MIFSYEVNGNSYNTYTRATLSNYNFEEDRYLLNIQQKMHGAGIVVKTVVPKWVLSPPKRRMETISSRHKTGKVRNLIPPIWKV